MRDPDGAKCKEIRPLLKEIDEDFDISFDAQDEKYYMTHKNHIFRVEKYGAIDRKLIADIRHIVWLNKTGQVDDYIDDSHAKAQESKDRAFNAKIDQMARDIHKPLASNHQYGA